MLKFPTVSLGFLDNEPEMITRITVTIQPKIASTGLNGLGAATVNISVDSVITTTMSGWGRQSDNKCFCILEGINAGDSFKIGMSAYLNIMPTSSSASFIRESARFIGTDPNAFANLQTLAVALPPVYTLEGASEDLSFLDNDQFMDVVTEGHASSAKKLLAGAALSAVTKYGDRAEEGATGLFGPMGGMAMHEGLKVAKGIFKGVKKHEKHKQEKKKAQKRASYE
jgi:hypothetical protein